MRSHQLVSCRTSDYTVGYYEYDIIRSLDKLKYQYPTRWSFTFQDLAILTRLKQADEDVPLEGSNTVQITERSIYSNRYATYRTMVLLNTMVFFMKFRYIFGPLQHKLGFLSQTEFQINCEWTDYLIQTFPNVHVDAFIYLQVKLTWLTLFYKYRPSPELDFI